MKTDITMDKKEKYDLGLPPMALAESKENIKKKDMLIYTIVRRICMGLLWVTIFIAAFIFLTRVLENIDGFRTKEILFVTSILKPFNVTLNKNDVDLTGSSITKRRKRHIPEDITDIDRGIAQFKNEEYEKARDIILNHDVLCNSESKNEICKDLVMKIKAITDQDADSDTDKQSEAILPLLIKSENDEQKVDNIDPTKVGVNGRNVDSIPEELTGLANRHAFGGGGELHPNPWPLYPAPHPPQQPLPLLTDTCLLARLLNQNHPPHQGSYDAPYQPQYNMPNPAYYPQPLPPLTNKYRSFTPEPEPEHKHPKVHPQDVEIFMKFLTPKPEVKKPSLNTTARDAQCPEGTIPCRNGDGCILENQWCNGHVDCSDVSDEAKCSCKSRVDKSRLCDGYFDCPFGEDEMGCYGCSENAFSCEDLDMNSKTTCFLKEQRCNNIMDCPNNRDEIDCNMLSPSLHNKPLFAVSATEGFLQRNFKGDWYAVCQNPYMWAHDACRRETGLIIRPPYIQIVPVDPMTRVHYLNTGPDGLMRTSDTCFNSSAIYVTCPELLCGTRIPSTSQLLRENAGIENHLFGRNKRYLLNGIPYPVPMYDPLNRQARNVPSSNFVGKRNTAKAKRVQSRVVGGRPSKPAAWPWMTAMYRDGMFHCGGVIITQHWVISAAHCVHEFWKHYFEVQVGMLRRFSFSPQEQNHRITHIIVNHHYNQADMKNDLSLLRSQTEIQFSRWVRPICLPGPNTAGPEWRWGPPPGTYCTAVGWGATVEHGPDPDHMRDVELPIWAKCKHSEDREGNEICAGPLEGGKDACQGDSGGPLLCRSPLNSQQWYLAGIVSHGDGCARKGEPGVYTRVSLFVKWIKYHIGSNLLPSIQPLQKCPGFKCSSGINKCLPDQRVCDKIVDCLNGEDELNCNSQRSFDSIFLAGTQNDLLKDLNAAASEIQTTDLLRESSPDLDPKDKSGADHIKSSTVDDFQHASPLEISISKSSEENSDQTTGESTSVSREADFMENSFILTSETPSLESRSSLKENSIETNKRSRASDIQEDFSDLNTLETTSESSVKTTSPSPEQTTPIITTELIITTTPETTSKTTTTPVDSNTLALNNDTNEAESKSLLVELLPDSDNLHNAGNPEAINSQNENAESKGLFFANDKDDSNKNIINFEDKLDMIHKIEDIVLSEIQPAKIRKKHLTPKEFECRRIPQRIPFSHRCDHKPDCEDGTDELSCTCVDYLFAFDKSLICDGIFDCADGQDEADCFSCAEDRFLCRRSQICLPMKHVCDGVINCPQGEDEVDCYALSNGKELKYNIDERPRISLEGYVTKKQKNKWHIVCEDNLSTEQQDQAAAHICHYLGFSSANKYFLKHINLKDEILKSRLDDERKRREASPSVPVHFTYKESSGNDDQARHIVIKDPQVLKEQCVPNVKKTCMSLYVYCDPSLFDYGISQHYNMYGRSAETDISDQMWPWIAKIFVDGDYKCTGVLVDLSLVLVSHSCLWDSPLLHHHVTAVLGSHRTLNCTIGQYEQILIVDGKKDVYRSKITLLHLKEPAEYSTMVRPMVVHTSIIPDEENATCIAVGQDDTNKTISLSLEETRESCNPHNKCYKVRSPAKPLCLQKNPRQWAGIISCHTEQGWWPSATFVDNLGECGILNHIQGTEIEHLKTEIKNYNKEGYESKRTYIADNCQGVRCGRGKCLDMRKVCNGIRDCEDGKDESEQYCEKKSSFCVKHPHEKGCDCSMDQFRCHNGICIPKEQYNDGVNNCGDGTDEPEQSSCAKYLARVNPSGLCDGILHCKDRSDEDPMFCKCFAKRTYPCGKTSDVDHCVAPDVVCDGIQDCPNGEDEQTCIGLSAPEGYPYGKGEVMVRSHGVWHSKCYPSKKRTKSELEAICRELGFLSGHAKELDEEELTQNRQKFNNILLDPFSEVLLNNRTTMLIRNSHAPLARAIFDDSLNNCFPVFIECL